MDKPPDFLTTRVHKVDLERGISGLCVGYEMGEWRMEQLVENTMEWLPEFSLKQSELEKMSHSNSVNFIRRAARAVYNTEKFKNRGEFGELFLHIAVRQVFNSLPAISKIYYKDSENDTVKGFDAVHVVGPPGELELWIGETKFYTSITDAIRDVAAEIIAHTQIDYLRTEFIAITNKIDENWEHADELKKLLDSNISLDDIFKRTCIPVLLTYDSSVINSHTVCDEQYRIEFEREIMFNFDRFVSKNLPGEIRIHLFLLPLKQKEELVTLLDTKLKIWQQL
ncbi:MAG: DUF1837 domain-containing protein [Calditrichaeota bacterium]|jgi:hypothetical protein|nr:DUF1837 domain-containing protein [Calditrichota bacterium]